MLRMSRCRIHWALPNRNFPEPRTFSIGQSESDIRRPGLYEIVLTRGSRLQYKCNSSNDLRTRQLRKNSKKTLELDPCGFLDKGRVNRFAKATKRMGTMPSLKKASRPTFNPGRQNVTNGLEQLAELSQTEFARQRTDCGKPKVAAR